MGINVFRVRYSMRMLKFLVPSPDGIKQEVIDLPEGAKGLWLHTAPKDVKDPPVFMWVFGGACFGGEVYGNRGIGHRFAKAIGADVFLADYRLLPEAEIQDGMQHICRAYEWLLT